MKLCNPMVATLVFAASTLMAGPTEKMVQIQIEAVAERVVDGEAKREILGKSMVATHFGTEAMLQVGTEFATCVKGFEEQTQQKGMDGLVVCVTPVLHEGSLLLKGRIEQFAKPSIQEIGQTEGMLSVQEGIVVNVALKSDASGSPIRLPPVHISDGTNLVLTFIAETIDIPNNGSEPVELKPDDWNWNEVPLIGH